MSAGPVWQVRAVLHDAEDCGSAPGFLRIVLPALCEVRLDSFSELSAHSYCTNSCQHTDLKDCHSTDLAPGVKYVGAVNYADFTLNRNGPAFLATGVAGLFISQALIFLCTNVHSQLDPQASKAEWGSISSKFEMCHEHPLNTLQVTPASPDSCTAVQVPDIKPSCYLHYAVLTTASTARGLAAEKKKNDLIFSSQLRADQMPGPGDPPREGQLMCTLFQRELILHGAGSVHDAPT